MGLSLLCFALLFFTLFDLSPLIDYVSGGKGEERRGEERRKKSTERREDAIISFPRNK